MFLFFFLAPLAINLIGGAFAIFTAKKIITLIIQYNRLSKASAKVIADQNLSKLNDRIKMIIKDPNKHNICDIGLYNPQTYALEECIEVTYNEMDKSLSNELRINNNVLILK